MNLKSLKTGRDDTLLPLWGFGLKVFFGVKYLVETPSKMLSFLFTNLKVERRYHVKLHTFSEWLDETLYKI
jgi:hypothetical protein